MTQFYRVIKSIIALFLINLAIFSSSVKSQWSIPGTDTIGAFAMTSVGNVTITGKRGIAYSTNYGVNWIYTFQGLPYAKWISDYSQALFTKGNQVFLGIDPNGTPAGSVGVYKSQDSGKTWAPSADGMLNGTPVYAFTQKDNFIFAGTDDGVYMSSNNGAFWYKPSTFLDERRISCFLVNGNTLFAGILGASVTTGLGIYASTNNGATWFTSNTGFPPLTTIYSMVLVNGVLFGTSNDGQIYKSTNNGGLWILSNAGIDPFYNPVYAINKFGDHNLLVGCNNGVFLSSNYGLTWVNWNTGLRPGSMVQRNAIIQSGNYVFIPANTGVARRDLNQVSVQNISSVFTENYKLSQNYPNPFNPNTKIRFELSKSSFVILKVYNSLGKEIAVLVNEKLNSGTYEKTFNASGLTSGIYFYKIMTDEFVQTKKMLLMK